MIDLVDSSDYHKDLKSESSFYLKKLLSLLRTKAALIILVWAILLLVSMRIGFAHIFICSSGIVFIFTNLGKRAPGTLSAYSIFNKNHEKLLGTFDAGDVDKQFGGRLNNDPEPKKKKTDMTEEEEAEIFRKIKESYEKNVSKFANQPCYCGSMVKYKKCCYWRELRRKEEEELERKKGKKGN